MSDTNYIQNPTFQPPYNLQDGIGELKVADKWRCGWNAGKKRPEWRRASGSESIPNWENAQQWFCTSDLMDGWTFQSVNVGRENVGKYFKLVVTCALESKNVGSGIGDYFVSIGIDRVGDGNVGAKTTEWLTPKHQSSVGRWTELEIIAPIEKDWITVYVQAANRWKVNGSIFVKSAYGYVIDNPCDSTQPPTPPSTDCQFDDSGILSAIEQAKHEILASLDGVVRITNTLKFQKL